MFRRRAHAGPTWTCGWTDIHVLQTGIRRMGEDLVRTARTGAGEAHAVAADGDRSTAACGRIVRMVVRDAWPPAFGDDVCPHCERVTTDVAELYGDITSL